ncbi:hypothetical protein TIFTF001_017590 [Ficus carica]|uniref:Uncharacterized protein n=1 Tax=Ficus carica TaxID=3494 RepID=A0AA88D9W8_FICCA|nr:hypothetical protein TIFTF001_017590 [Ficus carica]
MDDVPEANQEATPPRRVWPPTHIDQRINQLTQIKQRPEEPVGANGANSTRECPWKELGKPLGINKMPRWQGHVTEALWVADIDGPENSTRAWSNS